MGECTHVARIVVCEVLLLKGQSGPVKSIFLNELWHFGFGWSSLKQCNIFYNSPHLKLSRFFSNLSSSSFNRVTSLFPSSPSYILILLCMSCVPWPLYVTWHLYMHEETHSSQCRMTFSLSFAGALSSSQSPSAGTHSRARGVNQIVREQ